MQIMTRLLFKVVDEGTTRDADVASPNKVPEPINSEHILMQTHHTAGYILNTTTLALPLPLT